MYSHFSVTCTVSKLENMLTYKSSLLSYMENATPLKFDIYIANSELKSLNEICFWKFYRCACLRPPKIFADGLKKVLPVILKDWNFYHQLFKCLWIYIPNLRTFRYPEVPFSGRQQKYSGVWDELTGTICEKNFQLNFFVYY